MSSNQLEVEVTLEGYVYRAFVEDVKPHELEVSFENNWKSPCLIEFGKIRFPPDNNTNVSLKASFLVEVRLKDDQTKVSRWRKAFLREPISGTDRWLVDCISSDSQNLCLEVSTKDIRHMSDKPTMGQSTLEKVEFEIPLHLRKVAAIAGIHDDFQKQVLADSCKFLPHKSILRLISRNGESTRRKVDLLKISHINHLDSLQKRTSSVDEAPKAEVNCLLEKVMIDVPKTLCKIAAMPNVHSDFQKLVHAETCEFVPEKSVLQLTSKNGEFTKQKVKLLKASHMDHLESIRELIAPPDDEPEFTEQFEVVENLMGLALGKKYSNIKEARKIKDITSVELIKGTLTIQVCGKTAAAVKAARDMLEYGEHHSAIPRYLAEELLEENGKAITDIAVQCGLVRIECGNDDDDDESEDYPIVFVGTPPCVENAKVLMEYQLKLIHKKLQKKQTTESKPAKTDDPNLFIERVPIREELKGLAIGKNYENLKKAEKIPGVVRIDAPPKMPMIIIHAQFEAAAKAARRLLEFEEETVEVDRHSLGKIIGKGGVTIKRIESLSEGVRIRIPSKVVDSDLSSDGKVIIKLCGPAHKIPETIDLIRQAETNGHL